LGEPGLSSHQRLVYRQLNVDTRHLRLVRLSNILRALMLHHSLLYMAWYLVLEQVFSWEASGVISV
jgi:hypothetical protein